MEELSILDMAAQHLLPAALTFVTALLGWALASVRKSIVRWMEAKAISEEYTSSVNKLSEITERAVVELEHTLVAQLKRSNWNETSARTVRDTALEIVKRHLGDKGVKELQRVMGVAAKDVDGMVRTFIENKVAALGNTTNSMPGEFGER